ncbi:MAG: VOC family protein [Deinococcus sp.]
MELLGRDLDGQRRFYGGVLGLDARLEEGRLTVAVGTSRLTFVAPLGTDAGPLAQHFAFNIPPEQFAGAAGWLSGRSELLAGAEGESHFFSEDWNARMLYFEDADGNILELIARQTLSGTFPDAPFGPGSLLGVSEVGVACPDPGELAGRLERLGLTRYRDSSADFIPLGDEEGLLIVVREGRPWFPTAQPARPWPLRVHTLAPALRLATTPQDIEVSA